MFLLVIVLFSGNIDMYTYPNMADCEVALIQKTDVGNYKNIKIAECINVEEAETE